MKIQYEPTSGFTLVELLAVVGIIAILASVVVTSIGDSTKAAEEAAIHQQAKVLNSALQQYKAAGGEPTGDKETIIAALRAEDANLVSGIKGPFLLDDPAEEMTAGDETRSLIYDGQKFAYVGATGGSGSGTGGTTGSTGSGEGGSTPVGDDGATPGTSGGETGTGGDTGNTGGDGDEPEIAYNDPSELRGTEPPHGIMALGFGGEGGHAYSTYELDWLAANFDLLPPAQGAPLWTQIGENLHASDPSQFANLAPLFIQNLAGGKETMPPLAFRGMEVAYLRGVTGVDAGTLLGSQIHPGNAAALANGASAAGLRAMTADQWDRVLQFETGGNARNHLINVLDNGNDLALDEWDKLFYLTELQSRAASY